MSTRTCRPCEPRRLLASQRLRPVQRVAESGKCSLTMLKLPDDEFVALELVHCFDLDRIDPQGFNHLVVKVESMNATIADLAAKGFAAKPPSSPDGSNVRMRRPHATPGRVGESSRLARGACKAGV